MMLSFEMLVDSKIGDRLEDMCDSPCQDTGRGEVLFDKDLAIGNGRFASVQVIASLDPDVEPAWSQVVVFDEQTGAELDFSEPSDSFYGEYVFDDCTIVISRKEDEDV